MDRGDSVSHSSWSFYMICSDMQSISSESTLSTGEPKASVIELLHDHYLELTPDGNYVRWLRHHPRHPRNWSSLRKTYDTVLICLLDLFMCDQTQSQWCFVNKLTILPEQHLVPRVWVHKLSTTYHIAEPTLIFSSQQLPHKPNMNTLSVKRFQFLYLSQCEIRWPWSTLHTWHWADFFSARW